MLTVERKLILKNAIEILNGLKTHRFEDTFIDNWSERCIEVPWVSKNIFEYKPKKILDIGFSLASLDYMGMLLELKQIGVKLEAIDIVKPERVQSRYPENWKKSILETEVYIGDIRNIEIKESEYDMVTCISTIEHVGFDIATNNNKDSAFERVTDINEVITKRSSDTECLVLDNLYKSLKAGGKLIITVPAGKGGPVILKDSLGFFVVEWEYEEESWKKIVANDKFKLLEQHFFKFDDYGKWSKVESISDLRDRTASMKIHSSGLAMAILEKK